MDRLKAISKAFLFGLIMLAFLVVSALIAKALKLSAARTYLFESGFMLLSAIIPFLYAAKNNYTFTEIGFHKPNKKIAKDVLYLIPFIVALIPLAVLMNRSGGMKLMLVSLFFYACLAFASEMYFRGIIQKILEEKLPIAILVFFMGILYAFCNMFYFNRVTNYKYIIVLVTISAGFSGVLTMAMARKANIFFLGVLSCLFFFLLGHFNGGKRLVISGGIACIILLIYGIIMLIGYIKENKKEVIKEEMNEATESTEEENNEVDPDGFDENDNIELNDHE